MSIYEAEKKQYDNYLALVPIVGKVSKKTKELLEDFSHNTGVPISTIISRAIENEFDRDDAFNPNLDISHVPYVDENDDNSSKLYNFIEKHPNLNKEQLVFCRRDIGIEEQVDVLVAYRQLLTIEMIVEFHPKIAKFKRHLKTYKVCKVKKPDLSKKQRPYKGEGTGPLNDL